MGTNKFEIRLSQDQIDQIIADVNGVELLSFEEVSRIATEINKKVNIPFVNEEKEKVIFVKIVQGIDRYLYRLLPNEVYSLVLDATDGIDRKEARQIRRRLTPIINERVNIPIIPERLEGKLINLVLSIITNALVKGSKV